jgi:ABC-type Fe3+-hydroxamate transport system substrate-binding protein
MRKKTIAGLIVIVTVVVVVIFAGCVEEEAQTSSIIAVTARELCSAYEANEMAADAEYDEKIVKVSGVVVSIGKDIFDTPYITLECGKILGGVQCMFDEKYEPQLAQLAKGERVTVQGRCSGYVIGAVLITDCILE